MAHEAYSPVGYAYNADQFCLDCIAEVVNKGPLELHGCNCAECQLDYLAFQRGINRYDESSYDSSDFPKSIPYHNDIHAECQLEESWEPHWSCDGHCAQCGEIIDGTERGYGHSHVTVCPAEDAYLDSLEREMDEDDE